MFKLNKILFITLLSIFILALDEKSAYYNDNIIKTLNDANKSNIDFMCYNMCKDTTKGMSLNQLDKFCKLQCPIK